MKQLRRKHYQLLCAAPGSSQTQALRTNKSFAKWLPSLGRSEGSLVLAGVRAPLRAFQPFFEEIQGVVNPQCFRDPVITTYDGSSDPHDLIVSLKNQMFVNSGDDDISFKMFARTLKDVEVHWFVSSSPRSITNFEKLAIMFTAQSSANQGKQLVLFDLFDLHQDRRELLNEVDTKFFVTFFLKGLRTRTFGEALIIQKPTMMGDIHTCDDKHIDIEEATKVKGAKDHKNNQEHENKKECNIQHPNGPSNNIRRQPYRPTCMSLPDRARLSTYCQFHKTMDHHIDFSLRSRSRT